MGLNFEYSFGHTPLDEDELEDLLIPGISTHIELNEFEQLNIESAIQWSLSQNLKAEVILTEAFVLSLHKRMYGKVWKWAGAYRKTNKNIGVDKWQIPSELKMLLDDVLFWNRHQTYSPDEITIRFKHRLVSIHCFSNGNGRHSRLLADIVISKVFTMPIFSWGGKLNTSSKVQRQTYLQALKSADRGSLQELISFARS